LKVIQKWFGFHLAEALHFEDCVHGFVSGRSAVTAARVHCGARWVYSVDLENFFPSIPIARVVSALVTLGYPQHGADVIAKLCSYGGQLSQGSPASPVLSNLVFRDTDSALISLATAQGIQFTRYADDITFSGRADVPAELQVTVPNILRTHGWTLSAGKERLSQQPRRLKVHGLLIHGSRPRLTKGYRNKIRAYRHLLANGKVSTTDMRRVCGHLSYADSIETTVG
jgi:hypothetical protein